MHLQALQHEFLTFMLATAEPDSRPAAYDCDNSFQRLMGYNGISMVGWITTAGLVSVKLC